MGRAFRPFFLKLAVHAAIAVPAWAAIWLGVLPPPAWLAPAWWHGHEMIFGFVAAAIAGFLLTASPVWSGGPVVHGTPLVLLFALWLAGRVAMATAGVWPTWWVAVIDFAFLPAVALGVWRTLRGSGQRRNQALVFVLLGLALANALMHAEALGAVSGVAGRALRLSVDVVILLILVISGRITPAFTQSAPRRSGSPHVVRTVPHLDTVLIGVAGAWILTELVRPLSLETGVLAIATAVVAGTRLAGWRSGQTRSDPPHRACMP